MSWSAEHITERAGSIPQAAEFCSGGQGPAIILVVFVVTLVCDLLG
jgi:hypothetical protein